MTESQIHDLFKQQQAHKHNIRQTTTRQRKEKLKKLHGWIRLNEQSICDALHHDFRKPATETKLSEIFPVQGEINHTLAHLSGWMKPRRVHTPLSLLGTGSRIMYEPKGVALIIAPWNYPFYLLIGPLVSAIAAGCCAILKPSEMTPHTSALVKRMMAELFDEAEVAVVEGDAPVSTMLLKLPFDHIFFTGSPQIGKVVMRAAAENLTSVTLELGGKSPAIVDQTADIGDAAEKIVAGKFLNCGQTCIAPDYLLVHQSRADELANAMASVIGRFYGGDAAQSPDYTRIVNIRHHGRLEKLLADAIQKGATVLAGGEVRSDNYLAPTLLTAVTESMEVMREEIFGPILPILTYSNLDEAIRFVNDRPKPLALYVFSRDRPQIRYVLENTSAGGITVNDCLLHIANPDLPFGGVNNSGIGKAHGHHGFLAFSNEKAVLRQRIGFTPLKMLYPPYTETVRRRVGWLMKWL